MLSSKEIVNRYFSFYKAREHKQTPNVSLIPEGDSTLLFVNSGMFPLVPYLSGEPHPLGKRLVNIQRSLRFEDIEETGITNRHTTCFHMMGNWSLGDYFKTEQLPWIYQFFIEELGLDPQRLFATVFAGDEHAPKDTESIQIIKNVFTKYGIEARENERIFAYGRAENWWQRGDVVGELGGPDSEVFYYLGEGSGIGKHPAEHQDEFLEIGNSVFMQYRKTATGWEELSQKNVDFGGGLERLALVAQNKKDIFETDNFWPIIEKIQKLSGKKYRENSEITFAMRVVADHIRAATLLAMDGVVPSNKDQGYVLRRYIRRIVRFGSQLTRNQNILTNTLSVVVKTLSWLYPRLSDQEKTIKNLFSEEENKFRNTLRINGPKHLKMFNKISFDDQRASKDPQYSNEYKLAQIGFDAYQTLGVPIEDTVDVAKNIYHLSFNPSALLSEFDKLIIKHKKTSRVGAEKKFKGGLADHSEQVIQYHTATHLLHMALRAVLGESATQKGSNITNERLRFDFSHATALTEEEVKKVEHIINTAIKKQLPVSFVMLPLEEAKKTGALHFFHEKYPSSVKVYYIGESLGTAISKEFCGGPHVDNLSKLKPLAVYKQEAVGKGVRRVYARFT